MALTTQGRSYQFTAITDKIAFPPYLGKKLVALSIQGSGLTAGNRLQVRDTGTVGSGNVLADYLIAAATDNADLWGGRSPQIVSGLSIDNNTIDGTWVLTATFEG